MGKILMSGITTLFHLQYNYQLNNNMRVLNILFVSTILITFVASYNGQKVPVTLDHLIGSRSQLTERDVTFPLVFANPTLPMNDSHFDSLPKAGLPLDTSVIVIIGGSSGIGKAAVDNIKSLGYEKVVVTSRDWNNHPEYRNDVDKQNIDVTIPGDRQKFSTYLRNTYGVVNVLVLNSARVNIGAPTVTSEKKAKLLWETNYWGPRLLFKDMLDMRLFSEDQAAHVIVTVSIANDQFIIPNPDGSYQVVPYYEYYSMKPAALRYWMAVWAQIENSKVPGNDYPYIPLNLKISVVNPAQYATQLGYNAIVEDSDFARSRYPFTFGALGLPLENIGKAFGQLMRLQEPPLINYVVDRSVSVTDPNPYPAIYQDVFYRAMGYISEISVLIGENVWPPQF